MSTHYTHTIMIEPASLGERGQRYRVSYAGRVLLGGAGEPLLNACRALAALGITGRLEMWRPGKAQYDMPVDIQRGARSACLQVDVSGRNQLRFIRNAVKPGRAVLKPTSLEESHATADWPVVGSSQVVCAASRLRRG